MFGPHKGSSTSYVKHHSETPQWNTYSQNHYNETKQRVQWRSEAIPQDNHEQDHEEPDRRHL